jgi:hypothetical protein
VKTLFASRITAPSSLAAPVAARNVGVRALSALCLALVSHACDEMTSAIELSQGTEIPKSDAPRRRAKVLVLGAPSDHSLGDASLADAEACDAASAAAASGKPVDAGAAHDDTDADVLEARDTLPGSCRVEITLQTLSYGSGDEAEDDYAPNNVGAIWITKRAGDRDVFVRSVVAWGPTYFDQALTWIDQTRGNLVDTVTLPTRPGHMRAVEASWDCRNTMQRLVAAGTYDVSFEFTEVEAQGPVLTGERALTLELGDKPTEVVRAPQGYFGEIRVKAAM